MQASAQSYYVLLLLLKRMHACPEPSFSFFPFFLVSHSDGRTTSARVFLVFCALASAASATAPCVLLLLGWLYMLRS
jgi:hypothetical protein